MEIERKYLVERLPPELDSCPSDRIEQGYLAITEDGIEVRVRRYGERAFLTIKSGAGAVRLEEEIEIEEQRFCSLWPLTEGRRIEKRRYLVGLQDGVTSELDVYGGELAGLVTVEVEFESSAAAFTPPAWFGRDVTDAPEYKNQRLAVEGLPGPEGEGS